MVVLLLLPRCRSCQLLRLLFGWRVQGAGSRPAHPQPLRFCIWHSTYDLQVCCWCAPSASCCRSAAGVATDVLTLAEVGVQVLPTTTG